MLTSRGRFEAERLTPPPSSVSGLGHVQSSAANVMGSATTVTRFAQPVGSPFGFTAADWEAVSLDHEDADRLVVVFGHQWESQHFDSKRLRASVEAQMREGLIDARPTIRRDALLDFRALAAGYGEHLFDQIARDIIASDINSFRNHGLESERHDRNGCGAHVGHARPADPSARRTQAALGYFRPDVGGI